jgi:hypothetical protein
MCHLDECRCSMPLLICVRTPWDRASRGKLGDVLFPSLCMGQGSNLGLQKVLIAGLGQ